MPLYDTEDFGMAAVNNQLVLFCFVPFYCVQYDVCDVFVQNSMQLKHLLDLQLSHSCLAMLIE